MNLKVSELVRTIARAADAAEGKQLGHARCVSHLAYLIAMEEGVDPHGCRDVLLGGLFHDLGWLLLAPDVARVTGGDEGTPLARHPVGDPSVRAELRPLLTSHTRTVGPFLEELGLPDSVAEVVREMHDPWDRAGRDPTGTALGANILAVADHAISLADADLNGKGYPEPASNALDDAADKLLDPELTECALNLLESPDLWSRLTSQDEFEAVADEALYPMFGDFLDLASSATDHWFDLIGRLADYYHPMVPNHAARVKRLAGEVARRFGLSEEEARKVELAACLAEVGRIGLPNPLVFRLGAFTQEERELLHAYPTITERICQPIRAASSIFRSAITHREKLNGTGYPEGLVGDEIPLGGRIISVADTYIALSVDTPARPAYEPENGLQIIQGEATKLFDGLVVDALEEVVRSR